MANISVGGIDRTFGHEEFWEKEMECYQSGAEMPAQAKSKIL